MHRHAIHVRGIDIPEPRYGQPYRALPDFTVLYLTLDEDFVTRPLRIVQRLGHVDPANVRRMPTHHSGSRPQRFLRATFDTVIRDGRTGNAGACQVWPTMEKPLVARQAEGEERRLDFPACDYGRWSDMPETP